jgi:carbamate kinase
MRVVLALGGNALMKRGEPLEAATLQRNLARAAAAIAPIARAHEVVITHGNGPQIGLLALQAAAYREVAPYPLDILGAESEGMIGYLIEAALAAELGQREIATLLTQVEVDPADPAFAAPDKPIGPVYSEARARQLAAASGWTIMRDGDGWRRAVPSPAPRRIREIRTIELLVAAGVTVICAGGGGIPVAVTQAGALRGIEAVIDKDRAAALLAAAIGADALLFLTDVAGVWSRWPAQDGRPIGRTSPSALRRYRFAPGSMAPKVEAACRFVKATGRRAAIGRLEEAQALFDGTSGTQVAPD